MNISSLLQNSGVYNASKTGGSTGTQNTQNTQTLAEILKKLSEEEDSVSFSKEGMMRSKTPPEKPDFTNMSDEDLVSFLTEMQERTGAIPGVEAGTDASELTSEQLQSIRDALTDMSAKMDERMSKMQSMGRPPHGMGGMMQQSGAMFGAIAAYEANSTVSLS